jgi:hypothetical protein
MTHKPKTVERARVVYDGPSRPMVITDDKPPRIFSISEFINGRWESFDDEEVICEALTLGLTTGVPNR